MFLPPSTSWDTIYRCTKDCEKAAADANTAVGHIWQPLAAFCSETATRDVKASYAFRIYGKLAFPIQSAHLAKALVPNSPMIRQMGGGFRYRCRQRPTLWVGKERERMPTDSCTVRRRHVLVRVPLVPHPVCRLQQRRLSRQSGPEADSADALQPAVTTAQRAEEPAGPRG